MKRCVVAVALLFAATLVSAPTALADEELPPEWTYDAGMDEGEAAGEELVNHQIPGEGGSTCFSTTTTRSVGLWPANRALHMYTIWCGSGGLITYRKSTVWTSTDAICWTSGGPTQSLTGGGAGWTWAEVQAWGQFSCHTPFWFDVHSTLVQRIRYYPNGVYQTTYWQ
jgi:hypothetical protein